MSCRFCAAASQFGKNLVYWADITLNTLALGDPHETVSRRTARARRDGGPITRQIASGLCAVLTFGGNVIRDFRGLPPEDHCAYALANGPSIAREILHLSPPDKTLIARIPGQATAAPAQELPHQAVAAAVAVAVPDATR